MKGLKKLSVMLLLVGSIFMTGCDATQIVEMIGKIAQGVQQAMPAIQSVVDTFKGIFGNDNNAAANNNQQAAATNNTASATAETNKPAEANVITIDPNKEEVASPTAAAPETGATGNTIAVATQTATVATPTAAVAAAAVEISAAAQKQMDAVVAYALANLKQWGDLPAMQSGEARNFSGYLNASQRNLDEAGLKRLDTTLNPPITSPHDPRIPKGAVIVVAAGSTGTAHPTAGDITIKAGEGRFVNDGPNMDYGTAATWQGKLLGVYIPK
jgi:hypothetical protein